MAICKNSRETKLASQTKTSFRVYDVPHSGTVGARARKEEVARIYAMKM